MKPNEPVKYGSVGDEEARKTESRRANEKIWRTLAGDLAQEMLNSREKAMSCLHDPSWKIRLAAISILRMVWKAYEELAAICEKMAFDDTHLQVRGTALFTLACCYRGTNDPRISQLLRGIVCDTSIPNNLRQSAYEGLFQLRGVPSSAIPMPGKYPFPAEIDWAFVDSFMDERSESEKGEKEKAEKKV
jgi:hypothetical protein